MTVDLGDGTWTWVVHHDGELIFAATSDCSDARAAEAAGRAYFAAHYANDSYTVVERLTDEAVEAQRSLVGRTGLLIAFSHSTQTWELRVGTLANITTRLGDEHATAVEGATANTLPAAMRVLVERATTQVLEEIYVTTVVRGHQRPSQATRVPGRTRKHRSG